MKREVHEKNIGSGRKAGGRHAFECLRTKTSAFLKDPSGHGALILNHGCFQRIEQAATQLGGEVHEESFVYEVTFGAVGE